MTLPYGGHAGFVAGSETSEAAAMSIEPDVGTKQGVILALLRSHGPMTDDALEKITGWRHQSVSARRRELVLAGLVVDSGATARTSSGRKATVWQVQCLTRKDTP